MKKTYRTSSFGTDIDIFEVVKETDATVWIKRGEQNKTEQFRKISDSFRFFDTLNEAKKHLTGRYIDAIEYHKKQIERANEAIKRCKQLSRPTWDKYFMAMADDVLYGLLRKFEG